MMRLTEINVAQAKSVYPNGSFIDNDILLFDSFTDVPLPTEPSRLQCLFLALCLEGKARYTVDTREQTVGVNDVIIVNEGQVAGDYLLSRDCNGIAIMLSPDFFQEAASGINDLSALFLFSRTHPVFHLPDEMVNSIKEYFHLMKKKVDTDSHHFRREVVGTLMKALIYDISDTIYRNQQGAAPKQTRGEVIFTNFIKLVEQNFRMERRVSWYALQQGITPKYLSETVKAVSKRTPNEWIDNYVTMEIRVLLKNSNMSIKSIADILHFPNQSFLGKYFKEHVGMSPSQYRRS